MLWSTHDVPLPEMTVWLHGSVDQVYDLLARLEDVQVVLRDDASAIAEFRVAVGRFHFTTRERIWFDREGWRLIFEQLRSPFFGVRGAREVFAFTQYSDGSVLLKVTGTLYAGWGPLAWAVTLLLVRPAWARVEARHLRQFQARCQALFGGAQSSAGAEAGQEK